jgi:hypothetical protein
MKPAMLIEDADGTVTVPVTPASDDLSTHFCSLGSLAASEIRY